MSSDRLVERFGDLVSYSFLSSVVIGGLLILTGIFQDYIMSALYDTAVELEASGLFGQWVLDAIVSIDEIILSIPGLVDILWFASFILLVFSLVQASYYSKREGYFSAISFLMYGTLILMFVTSVFVELSEWFWEQILIPVLPNMTLATPIFTFYLTNIGIINLVIIVGCILVNIFDFDLSSFAQRKDKESIGATKEEII